MLLFAVLFGMLYISHCVSLYIFIKNSIFPDSCKGVTINGHSVQKLRVFVMDYSKQSARDMTVNCPHGNNTICLIQSDSQNSFWNSRINADDTDTLIMIGNKKYSFLNSNIYAVNARTVYIDCLEGGCKSMHLNMNSVCILYIHLHCTDI